jgi:competence protein ComEC
MTLVYLSVAWVAGIYIGSWMSWPAILFGLGVVPLLGTVFVFRRKATVMAALCLALLAGGVLRYQASLPADDDGQLLRSLNGQGEVEVTGLVVDSPDIRDRSVRLRVEARETRLGGVWQPVSGSAVVWVPRSSSYKYGDLLQLTGELQAPPVFDDFDYRHYLEQQGVYSLLAFPRVRVIEQGKGFVPLAWLHALRERLSQSLARFLPEPQASLSQAILLGEKGNIPNALRNDFAKTGTAHVLAISGLHVGIVAGMLLVLGAWLFGRRYYIYIWFSLATIWLYALLTGMNPPVVRAAIMASLFLLAEFSGRQRSATIALTLAAAVMVGIEPRLLWQVSFQLSFLAMLGLVLVAPPLQALGRRAVARFLGESGIAVSLAGLVVDAGAIGMGALTMTWPVISHAFGLVSLVGLPATLLVLPALAGIILSSAATGLLGIFIPALAYVAAWVDWLFLTYMQGVVSAFSRLPLASVDARLNPGLVLAYYLLLAIAWLAVRAALARFSRVAEDREQSHTLVSPKWSPKVVLPSFLAVTILVWVVALSGPREQWRVSFLDVGQGQAILMAWSQLLYSS